MSRRFTLGNVVATPAALAAVGLQGLAVLVARHSAGDWGSLDLEDKEANEWALRHEERLLSRYNVEGKSFYVVTEADRSATTVMLVEEY